MIGQAGLHAGRATRTRNVMNEFGTLLHKIPRVLRTLNNAAAHRRHCMARDNELLGPMGPEVRRAWWL